MSYGRIVESGFYAYPEVDKAGIRIVYFPNEELNFIPDSILDTILYKMNDKELSDRIKHGKYIAEIIKDETSYEKDFFKWREKNE